MNELVDVMDWWKENAFGIEPEKWATLVKYFSQGAYDLIWAELTEQNQERWEEILDSLRLCDFGRYGFSRTEAINAELDK